MDTSAADISADSARKRRHGQLGLTAAKKKAAEQPIGSRLDASGGLLDDDRRRFPRPPPASDSVLPR
ncbi:hypothetical protein MRX96_049172 [Rhipicephalus microplus]